MQIKHAVCFIPFKYALLTKREVVNMTGYMAKFLFLHFVRLSKSPLFFFPLFFSWLVMPRDLVVRLFAARTHALKLASRLRTYERWICSKSSILFNETKSRPMNIYIGQHDQTIVILIHYAFLLLFSILRVCRPPRHWFIPVSRLPFPASFASTLNVLLVFLISFARNPTSN